MAEEYTKEGDIMCFSEKIEGERIVLERARPSFQLAEELYVLAQASKATLIPWLSWAEVQKTPEDEYNYLLTWCEEHWKAESGYTYVIREKEHEFALGMIDFLGIDATNKSGEIGYWLSINAVGKGYMHEAVLLLEDEIFNRGFQRIVIRNDTRNIRSANVAQRAGYKLEGIMRQNRWSKTEKIFVDSNLWAKILPEWQESKKLASKRG